MTKNRWTKYQFKKGKKAKNRVVVPPMASQTADENGAVTEQTIKHYERLAQGGAGILFVEYSYIHPSGKGEPHQLGVDEDSKIYGLQKISKVIHKYGALAGFQLVHVGGKTSMDLTGGSLLGASAISVPVKSQNLETPIEMSPTQIKEMIQWYVQAAQRIQKAGFDIVELHAAHGYGLNQWLSPITNQRTDKYGGGIHNRARLLCEIIHKIKMTTPNLYIAVRMPAQDHFPEGLQVEEMKLVAQELEKLGVDIIDVSSGIGGWRRPRGIRGQGYLVEDESWIKSSVSLPVIGVGGIQRGDYIDEIVQNNKVDFAAVGRAVLNSPREWKKMNMKN